MDKPLISVIIPIYKAENYLSRCIDSVIKQSYRKLEIILVDDGSPDRCPEICDNYAFIDSRIKVIHKPNGGISSARNAGLDQMTGAYLTFIDSDDFIHKDFMKWLCYICLKHNCEMAACSLYYGSGTTFEGVNSKGNITIYPKMDAFLSRKIKSGVVGKLYHAALFKKERFPVADHFNYEDEALIYKLLYASANIAVLDKKLYYYYQSPGSTTRNSNHYKTTDFIQVLEERIHFFTDKNEKVLIDLSWEYYCICLMLFYMGCKEDKENINDLPEILRLYRRAYLKVIDRDITPIIYKIMLTVFYFCPETCALIVNLLHLRNK